MNIIKRVSYVPSKDEELDGYYLDPVVVFSKEEVNWLALTTPHGYLQFKGHGWRVGILNLYMWAYYRLPWTWKHD